MTVMTNDPTELFGDQQNMVERGFADLQAKTQAHIGSWGLDRAEWAADLAAGTIRFTTDTVQAVAPVQVIGTYSTAESTWLWGWDHPSVPEPLGEHARQVRDWAQAHGLEALLERKLECSEEDAWAFTALATTLADAQGAYRGPAGPTLVFMTFGTVQLSAVPQGDV